MTEVAAWLTELGRDAVLAAFVAGMFLLFSNHALHLARTREWVRGERLRVYNQFMQFIDATPHRLVEPAARPMAKFRSLASVVDRAALDLARDLHRHLNELELVASERVLDHAHALGKQLATHVPHIVESIEDPRQDEASTAVTAALYAARETFDEVVRGDRKELHQAMRKDLKTGRRRG
ncbi:MAG TPA: hypothetical protein VG318_18315 [Actinomycetota bacterium]|nr:hypothetical protein [Actinomycetota bacterium]